MHVRARPARRAGGGGAGRGWLVRQDRQPSWRPGGLERRRAAPRRHHQAASLNACPSCSASAAGRDDACFRSAHPRAAFLHVPPSVLPRPISKHQPATVFLGFLRRWIDVDGGCIADARAAAASAAFSHLRQESPPRHAQGLPPRRPACTLWAGEVLKNPWGGAREGGSR